jgi:hypothetical protein
MKNMRVTKRLPVALALVAGLSISYLANLAGVGSASGRATPVMVISKVSYDDRLGPTVSVSVGQVGQSTAKCASGYDVVSGGYHASGNVLTAPSVVTSEPLGSSEWNVRLFDPKTGGSVEFSSYALCERPTYVRVMAA